MSIVLASAQSVGVNSDHASLNVTVPSQGGRLLIALGHADYTHVVTSLAFNSVAMTKLAAQHGNQGTGGEGVVELWYMVAPPVGTFACDATYTTFDYAALVVLVFYGVDQATPFGTPVQGSSLSLSVAGDTNQVVVDALTLWGSAPSAVADAAQTSDVAAAVGSGNVLVYGASHRNAVASPGTTPMLWTPAPGASNISHIAVALNPGSSSIPGSVADTGGQLVIHTADQGTGYTGYNSTGHYDLTSSHFQAELVSAGTQNAATEVKIGIKTDAGDEAWISLINGTLQAKKRLAGGSPTNVGSSVAYVNATHRYLRIEETGGTVKFRYSANGTSWSDLATTGALGFVVTSVIFRLLAGNTSAVATTTVVFDNVNPTTTGVAPSYTSGLSVAGIPGVGNLYTLTPGSFAGDQPQNEIRQWYRGAAGATANTDASFVAIPGADQLTYLQTVADIGHTILAGVTHTNATGSSGEIRSAVQPAIPSPQGTSILEDVRANVPTGLYDRRPLYRGPAPTLIDAVTGTWQAPDATVLDWKEDGFRVRGGEDPDAFDLAVAAALEQIVAALGDLGSPIGGQTPPIG